MYAKFGKSSSALLASVVFLSGCATIPTGGSVNHYANQVEANNSSPSATAEALGPQPGASVDEIIRGFLHAGAGAGDNFSVAREYLTQSMADSWKPDAQTLVYSSDVSISAEGTNRVSVVVPASAQIDSRGVATSFSAATEEQLEFTVVQQDGEWRISSAPQGLVLSQQEFNEDFGPYTLYFYDPSYNYLVPDVRWLANRPATVTSLVRLTFEGPAPYLEDAVVTAAGQGVSLSRNSVPMSNGIAEIDLSGESSSDLNQQDINRLVAQLKQTLTGVLGVEGIQLSIDEKVMSEDASASPTVNPSLSEQVIGVSNQGVSLVDNVFSEDQKMTFSIPSAVVDPAMSYSTENFAALAPEQDRLLLGSSESSSWVLSGSGLTRPSFDQYSWVWSAEDNGSVHAVSVDAPEQIVTLQTDWLKDVAVTSFNVSRDGTRAVISGSSGGQSQVWVAGIIRDSSSFEPQSLGTPVRVDSGSNNIADWISDSRVIVGDTDTGAVKIVSLSGEKENLVSVPNLVSLNVGLGAEEVLATDSSGSTFLWSGSLWTRVDSSFVGLNYSG